MRLFFIRHGQSVNNALWEESGANKGRSEDPELTQIGHEQAHRLAEFIAHKDGECRVDSQKHLPRRDYFGFSHLYTSLMVRSVQTATHVAQAASLPLHAWPEIHEGGGIYSEDEETGALSGLPGKTPAYFSQNYQHLILPKSVSEQGWWNRPFEADEERPLRAQRVLETLMERHATTNDRVAIVSHGGFYNDLVRVLFRIRQMDSWLLMYNTAVSRFDFDEKGAVTLMFHNRTDHLPDDLLT